MKLAHVREVAVHYAPTPARRQRVGRLARTDRQILFEYDAAFLASRLELSPHRLRLAAGVFVGPAEPFDGLPGVFDDSLPDGWGRLLLDRRAAQLGLASASLTPLDRLTVVGARSMGALVYEPEAPLEAPEVIRLAELADEAAGVLEGARGADLERLIAVGGSPQGARPKVLIQVGPDGAIRTGARDLLPGATAWLVKFPARHDPPHVAALEHAYVLMAGAAGLDVPRAQVLGRSRRAPGYFAIERFDRAPGRRIHAHTLGGMLHLPRGYAALDYREVLQVTRGLTRDQRAVAEMYRRACFNVLAHNRDDHSRNIAFVMDEAGAWRPSPAYDLTYSAGPGGEHTTLVCGEGRAPGVEQLATLAEAADLRKATAILDEVRGAVARFRAFADEAGVPARLREQVASALGLARRR